MSLIAQGSSASLRVRPLSRQSPRSVHSYSWYKILLNVIVFLTCFIASIAHDGDYNILHGFPSFLQEETRFYKNFMGFTRFFVFSPRSLSTRFVAARSAVSASSPLCFGKRTGFRAYHPAAFAA